MNKITKRFVGFLTVLIVLIVGFYLINSGKITQESSKKAFPNLKKDLVGQIILTNDQKILKFSKNANLWSLDGNKNIDQQKVSALIDLVLKIEKNNLVSNNKEKQSQFEIGKEKIDFYVGNLKNTVSFGKISDLGGIYFKINEEVETFTTNNQVGDYFDNDFYNVKSAESTPSATPAFLNN
jgi:hypothetical protein